MSTPFDPPEVGTYLLHSPRCPQGSACACGPLEVEVAEGPFFQPLGVMPSAPLRTSRRDRDPA
jgi:hypothetical protein